MTLQRKIFLLQIRISFPRRDLLLFKHKTPTQRNLYVDLGDLQNEKENVIQFIQLHLQISVSQTENKLQVDSSKISLVELEHAVNKFIYHRDLNLTHWVSTEGSTVKINRFEKHRKEKAHEKEPPHQTAAQSWGL
jgi:hypothetical protein